MVEEAWERNSGLRLVCGVWLWRNEYDDYDTHRKDCVLCEDIVFKTACDIMYDIILPCGEAFMRSLTRQKWEHHQVECVKCTHSKFNDLTSPTDVDLKHLSNIAQCITSYNATTNYMTMEHCNSGYVLHEKLLHHSLCIRNLTSTYMLSWKRWYSEYAFEACTIAMSLNLWRCLWRALQLGLEHKLQNIVEHSLSGMPTGIQHTINSYTCTSYAQIFQIIPNILDICASRTKTPNRHYLDKQILKQTEDVILKIIKDIDFHEIGGMYQTLFQAMPLPNVSSFPCKAVWFEPKTYGTPLIQESIKNIYDAFKNWQWPLIPGYETRFVFSGHMNICLQVNVHYIRGPNFILGFNGSRFPENNTASFNFAVIDGKCFEFNGDKLGSTMYVYKGNDWAYELKNIHFENLHGHYHWKELSTQKFPWSTYEHTMRRKLHEVYCQALSQ